MSMAIGKGDDEAGQHPAAIYDTTPQLPGLPPAAIGGIIAKANEDGQGRTYDADGGKVQYQFLLEYILVKGPNQ